MDNKPEDGVSGERRKLIINVNVDVSFVTLFQIVQGILRACMTLVWGGGKGRGAGVVMLGVHRPI